MSEAARKRELKSKQKRIGGLELFNDDVCLERMKSICKRLTVVGIEEALVAIRMVIVQTLFQPQW